MRKVHVGASYVSSARAQDIYPLVKNSATWPLWSMIEHFDLDTPGRDELHGLGARRFFRTGRNVMHEEIVELVPNKRVAYTLLSGFPMNEYRAETALEELPGARTRITWRSSFAPKFFGTGWFWRLTMLFVYRDFVRALARIAENPTRRTQILALAQDRRSTSKTMTGALQKDRADA